MVSCSFVGKPHFHVVLLSKTVYFHILVLYSALRKKGSRKNCTFLLVPLITVLTGNMKLHIELTRGISLLLETIYSLDNKESLWHCFTTSFLCSKNMATLQIIGDLIYLFIYSWSYSFSLRSNIFIKSHTFIIIPEHV